MLPAYQVRTLRCDRRSRWLALLGALVVVIALPAATSPAHGDDPAAVQVLAADCNGGTMPQVASATSGASIAAWLCVTDDERILQAAMQSEGGEWSTPVDLRAVVRDGPQTLGSWQVAVSDSGSGVVTFGVSTTEALHYVTGTVLAATLRPDGTVREIATIAGPSMEPTPAAVGVAVNASEDVIVTWTKCLRCGFANWLKSPYATRGTIEGGFGSPEQISPYEGPERGGYYPYGYSFDPIPHLSDDGAAVLVGSSWDPTASSNPTSTFKVSTSFGGQPFSAPEDISTHSQEGDRWLAPPLVHLTAHRVTLVWSAKVNGVRTIWRRVKDAGSGFEEATHSAPISTTDVPIAVGNKHGQSLFVFANDLTRGGYPSVDLYATRVSAEGDFEEPFLVAQSDPSGSSHVGSYLQSRAAVIDDSGICTLAWVIIDTIRDGKNEQGQYQYHTEVGSSGTASFLSQETSAAGEGEAITQSDASTSSGKAAQSAVAEPSGTPTMVEGPLPSGAQQLTLIAGVVNRLSAVWTTVTDLGHDQLHGGPLAFPEVTTVSPDAGTVAGGRTVTVTGRNFRRGAQVLFGGIPAQTSFVSAKKLKAVAPAHGPGVVEIAVIGQGGSRVTDTTIYTYGVPQIESLGVEAGPIVGGNSVTIEGAGFSRGSVVKFGASTAKSVVFVSEHQLVVTAPKHAAGGVAVTVASGAGSSEAAAASFYAYGPPKAPTFTPSSGAPGEVVTIKGGGFTRSTTVSFGSVPAEIVKLTSSNLSVIVPVGAASAPVTVTNPLGSATSKKPFRIT